MFDGVVESVLCRGGGGESHFRHLLVPDIDVVRHSWGYWADGLVRRLSGIDVEEHLIEEPRTGEKRHST